MNLQNALGGTPSDPDYFRCGLERTPERGGPMSKETVRYGLRCDRHRIKIASLINETNGFLLVDRQCRFRSVIGLKACSMLVFQMHGSLIRGKSSLSYLYLITLS